MKTVQILVSRIDQVNQLVEEIETDLASKDNMSSDLDTLHALRESLQVKDLFELYQLVHLCKMILNIYINIKMTDLLLYTVSLFGYCCREEFVLLGIRMDLSYLNISSYSVSLVAGLFLMRLASNILQLTHRCMSCKINSFHCMLQVKFDYSKMVFTTVSIITYFYYSNYRPPVTLQ